MNEHTRQLKLEALMHYTKASTGTRATVPLTSSPETSSHHPRRHHQHGAMEIHDSASSSSSSSIHDNDEDDLHPEYDYNDHDTYNDFDTSFHGLFPPDVGRQQQQSDRRILTDDIVRAFLVDYYEDFNSIAPLKVRECWNAFYVKHYTKEYIFVRPSGNIITQEGIVDMFMHDDMQMEQMRLISVDRIQIIAANTLAVVVFTVEQRFKFKGTENADQAVYSAVLELMEETGEPKIVQEHRATGHPILTETRWSSTSGGGGSNSTATTTVSGGATSGETTATDMNDLCTTAHSSTAATTTTTTGTKPMHSPKSVSSQDAPPKDLTRRRRRKWHGSHGDDDDGDDTTGITQTNFTLQ